MTSITVMWSTHNRASILEETLQVMANLDRTGLDVQFVVVDNNSNDGTQSVLSAYAQRLPLVHYFEPRPGKNCALNHALNNVELGDVVVFTDDDISPRVDWLQAITRSADAYPDVDVFGGQIRVRWPAIDPIPKWANDEWIRRWGYAEHDRGDSEKFYEGVDYPFGGNFWVRRRIFDTGRRYDESIGPRPKDRVMGSEASFLLSLIADGHTICYCPDAVVEHRIAPSELDGKAIVRRAFRQGRGFPRLSRYISSPAFDAEMHSGAWNHRKRIAVNAARYVVAGILFSDPRRTISRCHSAARMGRSYEILNLLHKVRSVE